MVIQGWHPVDLAAAIKKTGWTHAKIADALWVSRSTVSHGIRTGSSKAVRDFVSKLLGVPATEIWPFLPPEIPPGSSSRG
ncbi:MAG: helix-turn-helix domain-containing protein [Holophagaceae bacterium]|nr:helix-turn-helix domain-containing protein [Holophagaceae bacterium]